MTARPWFPFYPADYRNDTFDLTSDQHAIYRILIDLTWMRNGSLPDDLGGIKRMVQGCISGLHGNTLNAILPFLLERFFFKSDDGSYHQKRVDRELQKAVKICSNATKNATKRWSDSKENNDIADAAAMLTQSQSDKEEEKTSSFSAATRLPTAERKAVTEFDLVLSDGTIFEHEEFEALNKEFGITNSRDRVGAFKRSFLKDCPGKYFMDRARSALAKQAGRKKIIDKPTKLALEKAQREERDAEVKRAMAVRRRHLG